MKTLKQIQSNIISLEGQIRVKRESSSSDSKLIKELKIVRQCGLYLRTNPKEDYLLSEKEHLESIIKSIDNAYLEWLKSGIKFKKPENPRPEYNSLMKRSYYKNQLDTINYLLS